MHQVTINGRSHRFPDGLAIKEALGRLGIEVPALCDDDRLEPYGSCRLCVVEVKGRGALATACNTPISDGMEIFTHSPVVEGVRRTLLRLLAKDYPPGAVERFPDKQFHRYLRQYGIKPSGSPRAGFPAEPFMSDATHPYINVDMSQCVTCYRCVRICEEVQGQFVWKAWNRGGDTRILPARGEHVARQRLRQLRRLRRHLSVRRARGHHGPHARLADRLDEDHLLLLRHRLRSERGHA